MKIANSLKLLFPAILLIIQERAAASTLPCNVTSWSIIGDEFNLRHSSCQEIPANGALKIAVPAGFDLSNSDIIKQKSEEGWALTKNGTRQITFTRPNKTPSNQLIEISLSSAKAPANYIVPFNKKFTKFSRVVTKQRFDCAQCTTVGDASKGEIEDSPGDGAAGDGERHYNPELRKQVGVLLALRDVSLGVTWDRGSYSDEDLYVDTLALREQDGWKDLTVDTDLETMVGKLEGITIDGSGLVTEIQLAGSSLQGKLPDFGNLTALQKLELQNNELAGEMGDFSKNTALQELRLDANLLTGEIQWEMLVDLVQNQSLRKLNLGAAFRTVGPHLHRQWEATDKPTTDPGSEPATDKTTIPPIVSTMTKIVELSIRSSAYTGKNDDFDFETMTALKVLDISANKFSGPIPDFSKNIALESINLGSQNRESGDPGFNGVITPLHFPPALKILMLSKNDLTGEIGDFSKNTALQMLDISSNKLNGQVPNFTNNTALATLRLSSNMLTGTVPKFPAFPKELRNLEIARQTGTNSLAGSVPDFSFNVNLEDLNLANNKLAGSLPDFSQNTALRKLVVNGNKLTGNIGDFSSTALVYLKADSNDFDDAKGWKDNTDNYPKIPGATPYIIV